MHLISDCGSAIVCLQSEYVVEMYIGHLEKAQNFNYKVEMENARNERFPDSSERIFPLETIYRVQFAPVGQL